MTSENSNDPVIAFRRYRSLLEIDEKEAAARRNAVYAGVISVIMGVTIHPVFAVIGLAGSGFWYWTHYGKEVQRRAEMDHNERIFRDAGYFHNRADNSLERRNSD